MEVRVSVPVVTALQAVDGMRTPFVQAFGRSPVGRRLAISAWGAFHAALTHGYGLATATSHARVAAEERNDHVALVARWRLGRIHDVVQRAAVRAGDAC